MTFFHSSNTMSLFLIVTFKMNPQIFSGRSHGYAMDEKNWIPWWNYGTKTACLSQHQRLASIQCEVEHFIFLTLKTHQIKNKLILFFICNCYRVWIEPLFLIVHSQAATEWFEVIVFICRLSRIYKEKLLNSLYPLCNTIGRVLCVIVVMQKSQLCNSLCTHSLSTKNEKFNFALNSVCVTIHFIIETEERKFCLRGQFVKEIASNSLICFVGIYS